MPLCALIVARVLINKRHVVVKTGKAIIRGVKLLGIYTRSMVQQRQRVGGFAQKFHRRRGI